MNEISRAERREIEIEWLTELLGMWISNIGYPVGCGVPPSDGHLRRAAESIVDRYTDMEALDVFLHAVGIEVQRARAKFPGPNLNLAALTEEVGELAQALLQIREGKSNDWGHVVSEAVQVAAMAMRGATEGDATIAVPPEMK